MIPEVVAARWRSVIGDGIYRENVVGVPVVFAPLVMKTADPEGKI
jgi:hypothetical protein